MRNQYNLLPADLCTRIYIYIYICTLTIYSCCCVYKAYINLDTRHTERERETYRDSEKEVEREDQKKRSGRAPIKPRRDRLRRWRRRRRRKTQAELVVSREFVWWRVSFSLSPGRIIIIKQPEKEKRRRSHPARLSNTATLYNTPLSTLVKSKASWSGNRLNVVRSISANNERDFHFVFFISPPLFCHRT